MELIRPGIFIDFMKYYKYALSVSIAFIILSLVSIFFVRGLNYGIDFSGGTEVHVAFASNVKADDVREVLEPLGFGNAVIQNMGISSDNEFLIRTATEGDTGYKTAQKIENALRDTFGKDKVEIRGVNMVGAAVSEDLKEKGFLSLVYACIGLLIYVWWRFEFRYSLGAILSLVHDVIITVGFFSFFGKEMSLTVIAALLTLIGFSLNDTVVVYDRIRENVKKASGSYDLANLISASISQTLSRTILTNSTVFVVVLCLFFFGGSVIHDFAFAMVIGSITGTYSSIFIASPIVLSLPGGKKQ